MTEGSCLLAAGFKEKMGHLKLIRAAIDMVDASFVFSLFFRCLRKKNHTHFTSISYETSNQR
ncbi:hypothetical protein MKW92_004002 [Papaver armeniacum]|nr:hypothetical protein MKW92_004002 [Papaver armeniacum]